jgi:hypothetical protein
VCVCVCVCVRACERERAAAAAGCRHVSVTSKPAAVKIGAKIVMRTNSQRGKCRPEDKGPTNTDGGRMATHARTHAPDRQSTLASAYLRVTNRKVRNHRW